MIIYNKLSNSLITDIEVHSFLNEAVFPNIAKSDSVYIYSDTYSHLGNFSINGNSFLTSYIDKSELIYMMSQLTCQPYSFDEKKLKNVRCISNVEIKKIFSVPKNLPEKYIRFFIKYKRALYKEKYHLNHLSLYSKPIFNKDKTFAIIQFESNYYGDLLIFKKIKNKWIKIAQENLWIS
ncbi:MAG: hypothetical protein WCK02_16245 [Bacteroidota bacterium]